MLPSSATAKGSAQRFFIAETSAQSPPVEGAAGQGQGRVDGPATTTIRVCISSRHRPNTAYVYPARAADHRPPWIQGRFRPGENTRIPPLPSFRTAHLNVPIISMQETTRILRNFTFYFAIFFIFFCFAHINHTGDVIFILGGAIRQVDDSHSGGIFYAERGCYGKRRHYETPWRRGFKHPRPYIQA